MSQIIINYETKAILARDSGNCCDLCIGRDSEIVCRKLPECSEIYTGEDGEKYTTYFVEKVS